MKKVLFATTATAALAIGGMASAQGIALFGDARMGLGYNIENDGDLRLEDQNDDPLVIDADTPDDLRVVSRVRFGVNMTGETDSGITFGATIRADNSGGGQGGSAGQNEGNVFVSGAWGTLTTGDTAGADENWIGDVNEVGLTCLGCQNETFFFSNDGAFGGDDDVVGGDERPTIRYDYDLAGFGVSLSSNRDLTDVGVGGGYSGDFGGGSFTIGAGYYNFEDFGDTDTGLTDTAGVDGDQWSVALGGEFGMFSGKVIYSDSSVDSTDDVVGFADGGDVTQLLAGLGVGFEAWTVDAYYRQFLDGKDAFEEVDGLQSYGLGVTYDLGGGARIEGGVASVYSIADVGDLAAPDDDGYFVADFGIGMAF